MSGGASSKIAAAVEIQRMWRGHRARYVCVCVCVCVCTRVSVSVYIYIYTHTQFLCTFYCLHIIHRLRLCVSPTKFKYTSVEHSHLSVTSGVSYVANIYVTIVG